MHTLSKKTLPRWVAFCMLSCMVGIACLVERFPLLQG